MQKQDHLLELCEAVAALQQALLSMGPGIKVKSIEIDDGAAGHSFDACIRSSPTYIRRMLSDRPSSSTIMDVRIVTAQTSI